MKLILTTLFVVIVAAGLTRPVAAQMADVYRINHLPALMTKIGGDNVKSIELMGNFVPCVDHWDSMRITDPRLVRELYNGMVKSSGPIIGAEPPPGELFIEFKHPVMLGEDLCYRTEIDFDNIRAFGPEFEQALIDVMVATVDSERQWFEEHSDDIVSVYWPDQKRPHPVVLTEGDRLRLRAAFRDIDARAFDFFAPNPANYFIAFITRDGKHHWIRMVYESHPRALRRHCRGYSWRTVIHENRAI